MLFLLLCLQSSPDTHAAPRLEFVASLATAAPGSEIVSVQASTARALLTHSQTGQVELFDLSDAAHPRSVLVFDLGVEKGEEITSAALPPKGNWFVAVVKAEGALVPGRALVHDLATKKLLAMFPCGVGPDCVVISPSGRQALIANEAEGFALVEGKLVSAPGSLTRIEFAEQLTSSKVTQIPFTEGFAEAIEGRRLEREVEHDGTKEAREVPLGSTPEFLEPEVVAFLPGEEAALVTLQENNAVARIDLSTNRVERLFALGIGEHPADVHDDGGFEERGILRARREPDGIAVTPDGRFFVTADEGDTIPGFDPAAPERPAGGARTLSVFEIATGKLVGDTGPELDRVAASADQYLDARSPKKGTEPEMVTTFALGDVPYAAVTLERAGAVALVDLSDPAHPHVVSLARSGLSHWKDEPEGLALFRDPASKADYLYVANEGSGTLGVLRVAR